MGKVTGAGTKEGGEERSGTPSAEAVEGAAGRLSPAGAKIVGAFEEAIEAMRPGDPQGGRLTVRTYRAEFTPRPLLP